MHMLRPRRKDEQCVEFLRVEHRFDHRVGAAEAPAPHYGLRVVLPGDQRPQLDGRPARRAWGVARCGRCFRRRPRRCEADRDS